MQTFTDINTNNQTAYVFKMGDGSYTVQVVSEHGTLVDMQEDIIDASNAALFVEIFTGVQGIQVTI